MARLARSSRAQAQEIPDSYEQQELSLSSSEPEDDDSEMIQHQLTQEQPDEDDDDDDGAVNLFLPDILDIVNKAASTPQKTRVQPQRYSSVAKSSPIAAQKSSPRSQIEVIATPSTESSTQSQELGHLANYLRKKEAAEAAAKAQMGKQKSSPLRRPSSRSKPISRSPSPVEENSQISLGKADPYDLPSSPEAERRPTFAPQPAAEKPQKRKRKEAVPVQRSATPEEPVTSKRLRRGRDQPEYSPSSLRKVGRSTRANSSAQPEQEEDLEPQVKRGRGRPKKAAQVTVEEVQELEEGEVQEEELEEGEIQEPEHEERKVPVVMLPIKRTRSRQAELDAEVVGSTSSKPRSLRSIVETSNAAIGTTSSRANTHKCSKCYAKESSRWHQNLRNEPRNGKLYCNDCYAKDYKKKKTKLSVKRTQPISSPQTGLEMLQSPVSTWTKSCKEQVMEEVITQVPATQSQPKPRTYPVPKSALAVYREQQQQQNAIQEEEEEEEVLPEALVQASSPIPETPKTRTRAKSSSVAPESASPRATRRPRKHFKQPEREKEAEVPPPGSQALMTETELGLETVQEEEEEEEVAPPKQQRIQRLTTKGRAAQKKLEQAEERARWQQELEASLAAEAEKLLKKKTRAKRIRLALAEEKAAEKTKEFFQTARATRSKKTNGDLRTERVEDSEEPGQSQQPEERAQPETLEFNMEDVPDSLFDVEEDEEIMVEGDRPMADIDEGQAQPMMEDDDEDEYLQPLQEDDEDEIDEEDEDELEDEQTGGTGGIHSILMNPSPMKVPSQKVTVPQRQRRTQAQKLLVQNLPKAGTSIEATRNASPPSAQPLDDEASASTRSQREDSPAIDEAAEDSATTADFGRNPFEEPTFNFTEKTFSATSRSFLQNMLLDRDVRELFQLTEDLETTPHGVARKTQHAKYVAKLRRYLVGDYEAMIEQHDAEEPDEAVICDLYSNVYTNTRKLRKKVNDLIYDDLTKGAEELSNGEQAQRNKNRTRLLRDVHLFVVPDLLKITTALIQTYCTDGSPGMFCFDELYGLVRLTLELERTAEDENNAPYRPKSSSGGMDYQYPKHTKLMKHLLGISMSCQTVQDEQIEYEKAAARECRRKEDARQQAAEKQRKHEAFLRQQEAKRIEEEQKDAEDERIRKEKLRAWTEKNAHILNKYKDQPIPRQVTQMGYPRSQRVASSQASSRRESASVQDPYAHDIRDAQPIMNGAHMPNPIYQHQLHVLPRRKPIVKAAERGNPLPSTARTHKLPLSNDDSDDDAFGEPQQPKQKVTAEEPRRKFKHYPITPSDPLDEPVAGPAPVEDDEPLVAPDLDSEEDELPEHPIARSIPRKRVEDQELSPTQQILNQDQRIKMLKAELGDIEKDKKVTWAQKQRAVEEKTRKIKETERKKAQLEVAEREYYEGGDEEEDEVDLDADLDETPLADEVEEYYAEKLDEEGYQHDEDMEEDQSVEVGTSFPGNNNRMAPPKPWTREDLNTLIECLKFTGLESKYMEAAMMLDRDQDDVMDTAMEFKEVWEEEYRRKTGEVPEWVRCIGENVACELEESSAVAGPSRR